MGANNPKTLKALIRALIEACLWLDEPGNRAEVARLLSSPRYLNMPAEVMARTLELPGFHVFQRDAANFPWRSHADWFLRQMVRWKQAAPDTDVRAVADRVYRTDIYRAAAAEMGVERPAAIACRRAVMASREFLRRPTTNTNPTADFSSGEAQIDNQQPGRTVRTTQQPSKARPTAAAHGRGARRPPAGAFAQGAGPETNKVTLGFIALTDVSPLIMAKERKTLRQVRHHRRQRRQAGLVGHDTRQHRAGFGLRRHRRRPHPDAQALPDGAGRPRRRENKPVPMYILGRLNDYGQGISIAKESMATGAKPTARR